MNVSGNIKSQATLKAIENAFLKLQEQDPDHQVSVTMLCQEVGINRATFYSHYEDIYDLQSKLESKTTEDLMRIFRDKGLGETRMSHQRVEAILEYIEKNRAFYRSCYRSGRMNELSALDLIVHKFNADRERRYRILFYRAGVNAIIKDWLYRDCEEPVSYIVEIVYGLLSSNSHAQ